MFFFIFILLEMLFVNFFIFLHQNPEESIIVNDPHTGKQEYYNREIFKQRWEEIGKKAVSVTQKKETIIETDEIDEKSKETLKDQLKYIVDIIDGKFWVLVQKIKFI